MNTQHTPGPWELRGSRLVTDRHGVVIAKDISANYPGTPEANAQLIQASPQMLEALEYVVRWHLDNDSGEGELFGRDYVTSCIAAIHQAKGQL